MEIPTLATTIHIITPTIYILNFNFFTIFTIFNFFIFIPKKTILLTHLYLLSITTSMANSILYIFNCLFLNLYLFFSLFLLVKKYLLLYHKAKGIFLSGGENSLSSNSKSCDVSLIDKLS